MRAFNAWPKSIDFLRKPDHLGVGSVIFAFVLWGIAYFEPLRDKNISAFWFLLGGCAAFSFSAFMAWSKADDRANERKPRVEFRADRYGFYLAHLSGDPVRFIEISPIVKRSATLVRFDRVDFIEPTKQVMLNPHLEIAGLQKGSDMSGIINVMFSCNKNESIEYPIKLRFRWNGDSFEERILLRWIGRDRRFVTTPQCA